MPRVIDLPSWPRRHSFEFFRQLNQPYFSLCTRVELSGLLARAKAVPGATPFLAYHHVLLATANEFDCLRQRIVDGQVIEFEQVDASTTVLRSDESLAFADLAYHADFSRFVREGQASLAAARGSDPAAIVATAKAARQDLIHTTVIPWLSFTSFSHPRQLGSGDAIPKFALGRYEPEPGSGRLWMPVHLEVHHALMDGLHVGRFFEALQARMA
ncbi:CatA-like O-acetyltransferase [Paucibacter soli]|uniref:CatA-like O-acetyltransferase n=1 Tax=Paucibacter soli TaxID=3133433 RepID=UPI0030AF0600